MRIQSINTYQIQPNFNSRNRVDQKNTIRYYCPNNISTIKKFGVESSIGKDLVLHTNTIKRSDRTYDSFTGLRDKSYLIKVLDRKIAESQRNNKNISIAMFDMDNFKSINELLGYEIGDNFIKTIGKNISEEAKNNSLYPYRFGGDEFVLVFNDEPVQKQKEIADKITERINSNEYIKSKEQDYYKNALNKLYEYSKSSNKVQELISLKSKRNILQDIHFNLATDEAKNDPYLMKTIDDVNENIGTLYKDLIYECIDNEQDEKTKKHLLLFADIVESRKGISPKIEKRTEEYLLSVYDKSAQIYQTKKWLSDFNINNGFSVSGSVVTFTPNMIKGKTPLDLIDMAGEFLKKGKNTKKGTNYIQAV